MCEMGEEWKRQGISKSLCNTLWLDTLVQRIYLKEVNAVGKAIDLRKELLKKGSVESNPEVSM